MTGIAILLTETVNYTTPSGRKASVSIRLNVPTVGTCELDQRPHGRPYTSVEVTISEMGDFPQAYFDGGVLVCGERAGKMVKLQITPAIQSVLDLIATHPKVVAYELAVVSSMRADLEHAALERAVDRAL